MKLTTGLLGLTLAISILAGCASQPKMTHEEILSKHSQISSLDSALQQARAQNAEILAPESYTRAVEALDRALEAAQDNNKAKADAAANTGLKIVTKLNRDADTSRNLLSEVLVVRDRAYAAGAKTLQSEKIADLDNDLKETATLVEYGKIEKAKQRRPTLLTGYGQLELVALKQGTKNLAQSAIADAKKHDAAKYAPKTLARAEEEMALAVTILDADRTQTDKAEIYSKKAKWLAEQSSAIAETIKDFDRRDYTMEDIVLWHQQKLSTVNQPIGGQLAFNESSDAVVMNLQNAVSNLVKERDAAYKTGKSTKSQLKAAEAERASSQKKDREDKQKFDQVQAMFNGKEANVYRQRQNVLISAHGFQFLSGQSEIQTVNFPLMNKITRAIKIFPNARIEITGHTDSSGSDTRNKVLSQQRAQKVAKFLTEVGELPSSRITSSGFGEDRPVASNETASGRAENRRVEIKIINE